MENAVTYQASCPVCGRHLFRGSKDSKVEAYCPKCKAHLKISFFGSGVTVTIEKTIVTD